MDTDWQNQRKYLVASLDCHIEPSHLHGGGTGWNHVTVQDWLCNWKLRLQISITRPKPGSQYPLAAENPVQNRAGARKFMPDSDSFLDVIVENERVEVWFPMPDCVQPFKSKRAFGASSGTTIILADSIYRCQAQLVAKPPGFAADLRRAGRTLEFVQSSAGHPIVIGTIEDWMPQTDLVAALKAFTGN